jgi:hypothetical protein
MSVPSRSLLIRIGLALAIGVAEPYLELAWKCRQGLEASEACVWGRSLFPLSRAAGLLIVAPIAFVVLTIIGHLWWTRGSRSRPSV